VPRKNKQSQIETAPPTPVRPRANWFSVVLAALVSAAIAGLTTYALAKQPIVLGAPLPPPPPPMFRILEGDASKCSLRKHVLSEAWLTRLAPQPDGFPPLTNHYYSEKLQFKIDYPYGAENVVYSIDDFMKDFVDSQALVKIDQPIAAIKVTVPSKDKKITQLQYIGDVLEKMEKEKATAHGKPEELKLPGGTFATASYLRNSSDGNYVHRLYAASTGGRALIWDFLLRPENEQEGEKYARKIMRSFSPGPMVSKLMEKPPAEEKKTDGDNVQPKT
jgi:hypothetical protein